MARSPLPGDAGPIVAVLPEGFSLPALPYLALLVLGIVAVAAGLWRLDPPIENATVIAFTPWMALGGGLHALQQVRDVPGALEPLLGTPSIYASVAIVAGAVWILAIAWGERAGRSPALAVGAAGGTALVAVAVLAVDEGTRTGGIDPLPAPASLLIAGVVAAAAWWGLSKVAPESTTAAGGSGIAVLFAHALDGVSTALGYDLLNSSERSPVSAEILEAGAALPTEPYVGAGWLFLAVKIAVAAAVVVLFREWLEEEPRQARVVLAGVAAVGLGPAANNLVLFTIAPA